MSLKTCDIREKAFRICKDYLNGAWKSIGPQDIVLKQISGGLSNFLYYCALPASVKPKYGEPSRVLLRLYGQVHGEGALESLVTESVIFTLLSERRLGPKLHGVFPGGRLEEFIPARPLKTRELSDPVLSTLIAEKMALIHCLDVPISKEPTWLWKTLDKWMNSMQLILPGFQADNEHSHLVSHVVDLNLDLELQWLKTLLRKLQSPVVFSHNDLQEGNILLSEKARTTEERLAIIDFEYCSYNYRAFDIANHFCEWMYDYTLKSYPNFTYSPHAMPSTEQQLTFIRCYLDTIHREHREAPLISEESSEILLDEEMQLLREIEGFILASHFFWGLWSVVNAPVSAIPFGYWEYAVARFTAYFDQKKRLADIYSSGNWNI